MKQLLMACLACAALWGASQKAQAQGMTEQKVIQLEHDLANAWLKGDVDTVGRYEAMDYVFTGPDGTRTGRSDDVSDVKTGNFKADAIDFDDLKVYVYGNAAVVTGKVTLKNCKYRSQDISGQYHFTDTWARTNGAWQIVASQSGVIPKQ